MLLFVVFVHTLEKFKENNILMMTITNFQGHVSELFVISEGRSEIPFIFPLAFTDVGQRKL